MSEAPPESATARIVDFASRLDLADVPEAVRHEVKRSLVDSIGNIIGGGRHAAVVNATSTLAEFFGRPEASLLGQGAQADLLHAALLNGMAGAAYSFFDSYSAAHLHAGVVHAAALLALSERVAFSGADLLTAYVAGTEVACRMTRAIALPPAVADVGWSIGGIVCGISSALAAGRLLGLDNAHLTWATGIAGSAAAGTRSEHGSATAALIYGQAAQIGLRAAILASKGMTGSTDILGSRYGFAKIFSRNPHLESLTDGLGETWEVTSTTYKPYPTDIAIHPGIDAMLQLKAEHEFAGSDITAIDVEASDLAATFCDRPMPANELEAKFSLQHWVAVSAEHGQARIDEGRADVVGDPDIERLRAAITLTADPEVAFDSIRMAVTLRDGRRVQRTVEHCVGSTRSPMSDKDIQAKFVSQAGPSIGKERASELVETLWRVETGADASTLAAGGRGPGALGR